MVKQKSHPAREAALLFVNSDFKIRIQLVTYFVTLLNMKIQPLNVTFGR